MSKIERRKADSPYQYRQLYLNEAKEIEAREYPPIQRTLIFGKKKRFCWTPYMIFVRRGKKLYVATSPKPIESAKDKIYYPPLPNIEYFEVCLDTGKRKYQDTSGMIEYFWRTAFESIDEWDDDWGDEGWDTLEECFDGSLKKWAKMNRKKVLKRTKNGDWERLTRLIGSNAEVRPVPFYQERQVLRTLNGFLANG